VLYVQLPGQTKNGHNGKASKQAGAANKVAALEYLQRGWNVMRLPSNSKEPYKGKSHAACGITLKNIDTLKEDENLGVYFITKDALKDIDFDYQEAAVLAHEVGLQHMTGAIFGRPSGTGHYLFNAPGCKAKEFELPDAKNYPRDLPQHNGKPSLMVMEIRGNTNTYTMVPPSVHPCGETLAWIKNEEPATLTPAELRQWAGRHALASVVLYFYPEHASARYEVRMALTGALARSGMEPEQVNLYVQSSAAGW
jgi:putative DNA primase/helicase